jgi:hypothetical protein
MPTYGSLSQYDGNFKDVFADKLSDALPSFAILQDDMPFRVSKKTGELFSQPILVRRSHGATYLASGGGVVTLYPVLASKTVEAKITGSQIVMRDAIDYESAFSGDGEEQAFQPAMELTVESLWESARHRIEADMLYGQDANGLGTVNGAPAANVITVNTAQFAPGLWTGMEGAEIEIFTSALTTKRTGIGSDTVDSGFYTITAVDLDAGTITVDDDQNVADTDVIFFRGQRTTSAFKTMAGLHKWLTNTGTLANVSAASYNIWKPNSIAAGGALRFDLILQGCAKSSIKGAMGEMCAYVHPIPNGGYSRIGATDLTFVTQQGKGSKTSGSSYFEKLPNTNAVEVQTFSHQAIYSPKPGRGFIITGIVNEAA